MENQFHFMEKQSYFSFQFQNFILNIVSLYGP